MRTRALIAAGIAATAAACGALFETEVEFPTTYSAVSAGGEHTCALDQGGAAFCWGRGDNGELGDGRVRSSATPVPVHGGRRYIAITAGRHHSCAIAEDGGAYCWGWNKYGQLGVGSTTGLGEPTGVAGDLRFLAISAGAFHTCALTVDGAAYCWGDNGNGQLGNGTTFGSLVPTLVVGGHQFVAISAGENHTCALTAAGEAYCWGLNHLGQLGDGTLASAREPRAVAGGIAFSKISAGGAHTCAIARVDGTAFCWGSNGYGELANTRIELPREPGATEPAPVYGGTQFLAIAAGAHVTCGIDEAGHGLCWGRGAYGQLGNGESVNTATPQFVADTPADLMPARLRFHSIDLGDGHVCGVARTSHIYCWGAGDFGQLGSPAYRLSTVPVRVGDGD
jgi:alpha-tubulin suppressor-like RCC1 family protein